MPPTANVEQKRTPVPSTALERSLSSFLRFSKLPWLDISRGQTILRCSKIPTRTTEKKSLQSNWKTTSSIWRAHYSIDQSKMTAVFLPIPRSDGDYQSPPPNYRCEFEEREGRSAVVRVDAGQNRIDLSVEAGVAKGHQEAAQHGHCGTANTSTRVFNKNRKFHFLWMVIEPLICRSSNFLTQFFQFDFTNIFFVMPLHRSAHSHFTFSSE